jgi:peptidoglycan/LPS O-acetylase OafA/YrhL
MPNTTAAVRAPLIDLLKVAAIQLIVWHHLAFYGPMSDVTYPWAPGLWDWLYDRGRLAVQVFLVIGGYLAAQSLHRRLQVGATPLSLRTALTQVGRRYLRLVKPYWLALVFAVLAAALARTLMDHPATPEAPTWPQLLAHALLLHSVFGYDGLSAGVWYIAIDLQLYALAVVLTLAATWLARALGGRASRWFAAACSLLVVLSLYGFNLESQLDHWAVYFFGAYGLGMLAQGIGRRRQRWPAVLLMALVLTGALVMVWRDRLVVAGITAATLACWGGVLRLPAVSVALQRYVLTPLADRSYALFLVHYPVCLAVNALVTWSWPDEPVMNALGIVTAWSVSLLASDLMYRLVEAPRVASTLVTQPASFGRTAQRG